MSKLTEGNLFELAIAKGLIYRQQYREGLTDHRGHYLYLDNTAIVALPEEQKLQALIELAFEHSSASYHEHATLLALIAKRSDLELFAAGKLQFVHWRPGLDVLLLGGKSGHVSLGMWLQEKGVHFPFCWLDFCAPPAMPLQELVLELALLAQETLGVKGLTERPSRLNSPNLFDFLTLVRGGASLERSLPPYSPHDPRRMIGKTFIGRAEPSELHQKIIIEGLLPLEEYEIRGAPNLSEHAPATAETSDRLDSARPRAQFTFLLGGPGPGKSAYDRPYTHMTPSGTEVKFDGRHFVYGDKSLAEFPVEKTDLTKLFPLGGMPDYIGGSGLTAAQRELAEEMEVLSGSTGERQVMSDQESRQAFRTAALEQGLVYENWQRECGDTKFGHWFDLHGGALYGMPAEHQVKQLVELAYAHATSPSYGEHNALLGLAATWVQVQDFEAGRLQIISWCRGLCGEGTVTLREWLAQQGQVLNVDLTGVMEHESGPQETPYQFYPAADDYRYGSDFEAAIRNIFS